MRFSLPDCFRENQRIQTWLWLTGSSLLVCVVVCFFFTPRFVIWRGLYIPEAWFNPEVIRAVDTLKQLRDPFVEIDSPANQALNWRLLFPLLAHYLRLPVWLYLMLPQLGCVVTIGYIMRLIWRCTGQRIWALMATMAVVSADWFFVSMGWLTYFDSWLALGLVIVSFSPSRITILVTCLSEPWIDERFVIALPLCAMVRLLHDLEYRNRGWRALLIDFGLMALVTLPYVGARVVAMFTSDVKSLAHIHEHWNLVKMVSVWRFVEGWWAGFRMAWSFAAILTIFVWRRQRKWISITTLAIVWGTPFMLSLMAGDLSRNMVVVLPALILGVLTLCSWYPQASRKVLLAVMVVNLFLPASHVLMSFKLPIFYLYHELAGWRFPPPFVNPIAYLNEGIRLLNAGRLADAKHSFDNAIQLNPKLSEAFLARGMTNFRLQDFPAAESDLSNALRLNPRQADALYFRGLVHVSTGAREAAIGDLTNALTHADSTWLYRQDCKTTLAQFGIR